MGALYGPSCYLPHRPPQKIIQPLLYLYDAVRGLNIIAHTVDENNIHPDAKTNLNLQ